MATSEFQNSSPSSSEFKGRYDIFLSFRGLDTRKKFTDHLYHALKREGFQTFRDDDEINRGDVIKPELQKAIANSRMSVIVLSKNYANSTACLLEVETILKQSKKSDHFVLPVFYEVDPGEIKEKAKNLDFGKKRVTVEQVKEWSAALKEVASMAGMVSQNQSNGYEADFIEEIVGELKSKLVDNHLRVGDHLVSMDSRIKRVTSWLEDMSTTVGILLICGMGGIGKTTIAKAIFNLNHGRFDAACFLQNISEVAKAHNGLVSLQRQLLSDILKKERLNVNDVDDGCRRIKYALSNKRVLLVLDDVDQMDQLFALTGNQDWFFPRSKIIITTRIESMMNANGIHEVYRPEKLTNDESLELFSWHAFGKKHPIQGHMDLSRRFVQHCDGLPLALQVLGSSVRRKRIDVWESELQKLEATSNNTILEKLEISYDSLKGKHDKDLFLDIACFFVGKEKNEMIKILEGCDCSPLAGIHNLVDRNLLTIENETLQMHRLLQDMGKQIVCRESKHPEKRSRIWHPRESFNILLEKTGTEIIEGLVLDMNMLRNSDMPVIEANTFEKMYNLRLLKLSGVRLSGTSKAFPKRLRWLYWLGFPSTSFPNDFPLENLVSLDMRYSNLKQLWKGTKVLGSLKILNLSHSPKLAKTPDFSSMPNLEKLVLKACPSLFKIDESIVELQRIESLNLQDCKNLKKLPRNIGMLESLVEMDISGCSNLMGAMEELGKMKSLQVLMASGLKELVSQAYIWPWVPKSWVQMSLVSLPSSLVRLELSNCNLTEDAFPRDLKLSKLQHLSLSGNPISSLPNFIKYHTSLKNLDLSSCPKLTDDAFPKDLKLSKLESLHLSGNPISSLPNFIKDHTSLLTLNLKGCPKLQQIQWPSTSLVILVVDDCDALEKVTFETGFHFGNLSHIGCSKLNYIQGNYKVSPIREVDVELLKSIGFFNLDSMADVEAKLVNNCSGMLGDVVPIQILYQDHAFHTFFPGREVLQWFSKKNDGSSISFTTTLSPHFGFRGLNLCAVYTLPDDIVDCVQPWQFTFSFEIGSKILCKKTIFKIQFYGIPEKGGDMVWLSHCFKANMFTKGEEVEVSFRIEGGGQIKECGVHPLYLEGGEDAIRHLNTIGRSWDPYLSVYGPEEGMYEAGMYEAGVYTVTYEGGIVTPSSSEARQLDKPDQLWSTWPTTKVSEVLYNVSTTGNLHNYVSWMDEHGNRKMAPRGQSNEPVLSYGGVSPTGDIYLTVRPECSKS